MIHVVIFYPEGIISQRLPQSTTGTRIECVLGDRVNPGIRNSGESPTSKLLEEISCRLPLLLRDSGGLAKSNVD